MTQEEIDQKVIAIKTAWRRARLEWMTKGDFTEAQWQSLARYALNPQHDEETRRGFPIKMAAFSEAAQEVAFRYIKQMQGMAAYEPDKLSRYPAEFGRLLREIEKDMQTIDEAFFGPPSDTFFKQTTEINFGRFNFMFAATWHSDGNNKGPVFVGRMRLPPWFKDGEGKEFRADDNGIYVMAAKYLKPVDEPLPQPHRTWPPPGLEEIEGTSHRSDEMLHPTLSLFARHHHR